MGQQARLHRSTAAKGEAFSHQILNRKNLGAGLSNKMGDEVKIHVTHGDDAAGVFQLLFNSHVVEGAVPSQVDITGHKCVHYGHFVGIEHPFQVNAQPLKVGLNPLKCRHVGSSGSSA